MIPAGIIRTPAGVHVLAFDSHLSRWIEEHGRLDIARGEIAFYQQHIPVGGVVIDAGASLGDHTATYAQLVGPIGSVHAFEPQPLSFEALRLNFENARNVRTYNLGLSSYQGTAWIRSDENAGCGQIDENGDVLVNITTIDHLRLERLDFVHLDCEGCEIRVLRGGEATIKNLRPVIVLEVNHKCLAHFGQTEADVHDILAELGYRWHEIEPHHGPHLAQRDILCLPV